MYVFFFFKQKTAYDMRISDWSSDVCSSDLDVRGRGAGGDADVASAFEPLRIDLVGAVDQVGLHAFALGQLAQAVGVGAVGRADHQYQVALRGELAHRVLAVLGGVADVVVLRALDRGEPVAQRLDHATGVVDRERGLGGVGEVAGLVDFQRGHVLDVLDQVDPAAAAFAVPLPHRALDLGMAGVADQHHVAAGAAVARDLEVHLGHQRAGRVEPLQPPPPRPTAPRLRDAVGAEDNGGSDGAFVQPLAATHAPP